MTGTGQAITADSAIVDFFINSFSAAGNSYDHIACSDFFITDDPGFWPACSHSTIDGNRPDQVAYVRSFPTHKMNGNAVVSQFIKKFLRAFNNSLYHFTRNP